MRVNGVFHTKAAKGYTISFEGDRVRYSTRCMKTEQRRLRRGRKTFTEVNHAQYVGSNRQIDYQRVRGD